MTKGLRRWMLFLVMLVATIASAQPPSEPTVLPHAAHGLFTGDEWRYDRDHLLKGFALRLVADLVSIPTGAPWWTPSEWVLFGTIVGSTAALSAGDPSVDVTFQNFTQVKLLGLDHFRVWGTGGDLIIWSCVGVVTISILLYGLIAGDAMATETSVLMFEAVVIAQLYHQMIKLLTGRAGPQRPELEGHYFGPTTQGIWLYPEGTPSGHIASIYALLSVVMHMVDHPLLWVGGNMLALIAGASLTGDNYHWLSEVTFGAAMGFVVGRWVVRHRSTHYVYGVDAPRPPVEVSLLPLILPSSGAAGLGIVGTF